MPVLLVIQSAGKSLAITFQLILIVSVVVLLRLLGMLVSTPIVGVAHTVSAAKVNVCACAEAAMKPTKLKSKKIFFIGIELYISCNLDQ
jgi:hypothetical protein